MSLMRLNRISDAQVFTSAGREVLKWLALVLMTGDHVNKVVLHGSQPWLTDMARVVFPIFAVVLVYNLRVWTGPNASWRAIQRIGGVAILAQPVHAWAFGYWLPLNVLVTLAAGIFVCAAWERSRWTALTIWLLAGLVVDYQWYGIGVMVAAMVYFRAGCTLWPSLALMAAIASLVMVNGNLYALAALPIMAVVGQLPGSWPRCRWLFLGYYVAHLTVISLL